MKEQRKRATIKLALWTVLWVVSTAISTFGPMFLWETRTLTVVAIALNLIIGIGAILANVGQFHTMDELEKKIQLEAMAVSLGITVVFGISYSMMEQNGLIESAEIGFLIIVQGISFYITMLVNRKRFA